MRVIIQGSWAKYVGTDYCDALGIFDSLEQASLAAMDYAWNTFEEDEDDYNEDGKYEGEGPDYYVEEYDPDKHDMLKAGGGTFADDFERMK